MTQHDRMLIEQAMENHSSEWLKIEELEAQAESQECNTRLHEIKVRKNHIDEGRNI